MYRVTLVAAPIRVDAIVHLQSKFNLNVKVH